MKAQLWKSSLAVATIIAAIGIIAAVDIVAADASIDTTSCNVNGDDTAAGGFSSTTCEQPAVEQNSVNNYSDNCYIWPSDGVPFEHTNMACNRAIQNAELAVRHAKAESAPPADLVPDTVYLNLPEEKSWVCPLDMDSGVDSNAGKINYTMMTNNNGKGAMMMGHRTKWVLHNRASNPIIVTHVNALGLEVAANDFSTYPAHSNTAVFPDGPIVLPGTMAVIEGRMGQTFVAREYREVMPLEVMQDMQGVENKGGEHNIQDSWKSFKSVLPPTLSFLPEKTRYTTNKGVMHVLGRSGRALMKHRMGNIYVENKSGALCPEALGLSVGDDDDGRMGNPKDMDPDCNVLNKAFINKVGCPVDLYFAPEEKFEGYNCEKFTLHLGPLESFVASSTTTRNIDGYNSPLKFQNTYNGHNFVARMSHDQSLVARIELDHDVVKDCPEPKKNSASVEVHVDERILRGVTEDIMTINATKLSSMYSASSGEWVATKVNATASTSLPVKVRDEKQELLGHNNTMGIMSTSMPIAS